MTRLLKTPIFRSSAALGAPGACNAEGKKYKVHLCSLYFAVRAFAMQSQR